MKTRTGLVLVWLVLSVLYCGTPSAQQRWVYRYDGPGSNTDEAQCIFMGSDGNLYAGGHGWGSGTGDDYEVVSLSDLGAERWVYRYNGSGSGWDWAYSIAAGSSGDLYVGGYSLGGGVSPDFAIVSLTDSGGYRWAYRYHGPGTGWDAAYSVIVGSDGNIYAAGSSWGDTTNRDFTVASVTDSGTERWIYVRDGSASYHDEAVSIIMGLDGNLYAAGYSEEAGTAVDLIVVSLTESGAERWVYTYDGPASGWDGASSIIMGSDGNLYVAGYTSGIGTSSDFTVVSLDTSGAERWVYQYNGTANDEDGAASIVMGSDGNLYAAGTSWETGNLSDFAVVSLTDSGVERWIYRYNGPGNLFDDATSIVMGLDGNLYVAGSSWGAGTSSDFTVASVTDSGIERWVYRYDGPADSTDMARAIVAGSDGNLYIAGYSTGNGTSEDFTVVSLSTDVLADAATLSIDLPPDTVFVDSTYAVRAVVRNAGNSILTFNAVAAIDGYSDTVQVQELNPDSSAQVDFQNWQVPPADSTLYGMTVCVHVVGDVDTMNDCLQKTIFAYDPVGIEEGLGRFSVIDLGLAENSPNPFRAASVISYALPAAAHVTLEIFDVTGGLVQTLVNETERAGMHEVRWSPDANPAGVYFCRLEAGKLVETRKMVVVK